jgi:sulfate adenylyltransferase subunit 1 (EFTu-like GTPase family)
MQNQQARHIQSDIETIRLNYQARMNLNQYRRDRMVGWSLVIVALAVPGIAAGIILILL